MATPFRPLKLGSRNRIPYSFLLILCLLLSVFIVPNGWTMNDENPASPSKPPPQRSPAVAQQPREVEVTASALNMRSADGSILCSLSEGTVARAVARSPDSDRLQVEVNARGCPRKGFVSVNFVRPKDQPQGGRALVETSGLALRSEPRAQRATYRCSLQTGTPLDIVGDGSSGRQGSVSWVEVTLPQPPAGCPSKGFVARYYLQNPDYFSGLPVARTEQDEDCTDCGNRRSVRDSGRGDLERIGRRISRVVPDAPGGERVQRLVREARRAAGRCRSFARHVCQRIGARFPCGSSCSASRSKGLCKAAVREATERALGFTIPGQSAWQARSTLERRMRNSGANSCQSAPVGAICVYSGGRHGHGHIEVKTARSQYCSDYCAARPVRNRTFLGAYMPR
jgi:hypothetical protein